MSAQVHIGVTLLLLISCFLSSTQCQHRPNILLILVDDLGYNDLDWRDTRLFTPNIRRLAFSENTVQLANSYVNHLCTPTRASLMSGYYPHRTGTEDGVFLQMEMSGVPTDLPFLPQSLKPLGYNTYLIGKWHLGYCKRDFLPTARGFDSFYGYYGPQEGYFNHSASVYNRAIGKHVDGLDLFYEKNGISIPDFTKNGVYSTNLFLQETMRVLDSHPRTNPFFLFLSFQSVHAPLQVPSHYRIHCPFLGHDKKRHIYCAMLAALDEATGQLIAYLKQKQLYENTIIIFTSDNGGDPELGASNFPYRGGKSTIWEGGTKTTTFIHAPSYIQRFAWRNELFHVVDWYATILGMVGSTGTSYGDGINQWEMILTGKGPTRRSSLVYNLSPPLAAIRWNNFKLVYEVGSASRSSPTRIQLYRLDTDPYEKQNVARMYPTVVKDLIRRLHEYKQGSRRSVRTPMHWRGSPEFSRGAFGSYWCK